MAPARRECCLSWSRCARNECVDTALRDGGERKCHHSKESRLKYGATSSTANTAHGFAARVGFMQGRMSALVEGRIQAFPWSSWEEEFPLAEKHGFQLMEWTLDQHRMHENPLMTASGQEKIRQLMRKHDVRILSLTGDCFMQAPFWKTEGKVYDALTQEFLAVATACYEVGISMIIVPLVDNGRLETSEQEGVLVKFLQGKKSYLSELGIRVLFECDFAPAALCRLMERFDATSFGINYDIGNSSALGFDADEEIAAYGNRIVNVHVKDRKLGGTTVPLGTGAADFAAVFTALKRVQYAGNFILQTARAGDGDHLGVLCRYRDMTIDWLKRDFAA